ncbi:MAG TPA: DUF1543 domain-containing protein [Lacipirellulaceae bacterium]|jgi:hypothetical protein|nr:DUF1543 domain-containing protein [Lacipirellulaceae bacterium]
MPSANTNSESSDTSQLKLFAVYLGGRAPRCNTELHDVVFTVGASIEDTYHRLLELWFGSPEGLHIDSWMELSVVDHHRIRLTSEQIASDKKLYFVNLGAYAAGQFTELHANAMFVAASEQEVKTRAKAELLVGKLTVHTDDLFDIDDCLELMFVDGYSVRLEPTADASALYPNNGYHVIPKPIIAKFIESRRHSGDR